MDKVKLHAELEQRLTSRGLITYAWDYFKSFGELNAQYPELKDRYEVKYFLLCHAIELAMKACLREKGYTREQLVAIGHDLERLIEELRKNEMLIDDVERSIGISLASQYYHTKQFEYPQTGCKYWPDLVQLNSCAELLLNMANNAVSRTGSGL